MANPWLTVPLSDYEGHMSSAGVCQLEALSDLFGDVLASVRPTSVAILGIAGGNGLERIDSTVIKRIVGVDVNAAYLDAVKQRYPDVPGLELHGLDLSKDSLRIEPVQLVHAALVFEHTGVGQSLDNALSLIATGGSLSIVLQLPSHTEAGVSPTAFSSMQNIKPHFSFIDPESLVANLESRQWKLKQAVKRPLPAGKALWMGVFNHC